jgi:hypothetical protein
LIGLTQELLQFLLLRLVDHVEGFVAQFDLMVAMNNDIPCTNHRQPWDGIMLFLKLYIPRP